MRAFRRARRKTRRTLIQWRVLDAHAPAVDARRQGVGPYVAVVAMVGALTALLWIPRHLFEAVNIALLYLLPVLYSAVKWGLRPALFASGLGVMAFDFFFIPPIFSYAVSDVRYLISFAVFLVVAVLTASLASSLQQKTREAERRARMAALLLGISRRMARVNDAAAIGQIVVDHVAETWGVPAAVLLPKNGEGLEVVAESAKPPLMRQVNPTIASWVYHHGQVAGYGTKPRPELLYVPLKSEDTVYGVLCLGDVGSAQGLSSELRLMAEAVAGLAAISVARVKAEEQARLAVLTTESERIRTALMDSLSHELRTPVTAILGAVASLREAWVKLGSDEMEALVATIRDSALRMNRLITNLLGMVRLESGMMRLNRKICDIADVIGVALGQMEEALEGRPVAVNVPEATSPVMVDEVLLAQALVNVLSNAVKYSPDGSPIEIHVEPLPHAVRLSVRDYGIGVDAAEVDKLFEKFYRSPKTKPWPGTGLGLAICQGIVSAHGGRVWAEPATPRGTVIRLEIPRAQAKEANIRDHFGD
ncbi:MAG: DUF4118 domain-containing protein [Firmicutes bacterium]|nr:DUF4118 domain-containing protein [Bacillota bacterium]